MRRKANNSLSKLARGYYEAYNNLMEQARMHHAKSKEFPDGSYESKFYISQYQKLYKQARECKEIGEICEKYYDKDFYIGNISSPAKGIKNQTQPERNEFDIE